MQTSKKEMLKIHSTKMTRVSKDIIKQFLQFKDLTSTISDVLDSLGILGAIPASILKPVIKGKKIVGPAVKIRHISENMNPAASLSEGGKSKLKIFDILPISKRGDILVIDGGSRTDVSSMGELAALLMKQKGLVGSIVDCGTRDISSIRELDYPVWSSGVTPITGKMRFETVEINGPVTCAGIPVRPGDLIAADDTGITIIPLENVDDVLKRVFELSKAEEKLIEAIHQKKPLKDLELILPKDER